MGALLRKFGLQERIQGMLLIWMREPEVLLWDRHSLLRLQGTAATAVAGVYGALRVQGKSNKELARQRIVLVGAGSAGMGVARMLALGMVKQVCWRTVLRASSLHQLLFPALCVHP